MFDAFEEDFDFDTVLEILDGGYGSLSPISDDSQESVSTDDNSEESMPARKKRKSSRPPVLIPRLLLTDIRRSYATMFINALNTNDYPFLFEFLSKYTARNVSMFQETNEYFMCTNIDLSGLQLVGQFFYNKMQLMPDAIHMLPMHCQVVTFPDATSKIVAYMEVIGTRLFDVPLDILIPSEDPSENNMTIVSKSTKQSVGVVDATIVDRLRGLPVLSVPVETKCMAHMTMYLNPQKEIKKFEFLLAKGGGALGTLVQ